MRSITENQTEWLRKRAAPLPYGVNTFIVTQFPNSSRAFSQWSTGMADGEALALGLDGSSSMGPIGRIKIEDWPEFRP